MAWLASPGLKSQALWSCMGRGCSQEGLTKAGASPSTGLTHSPGQLVLALVVGDLPSFPQGSSTGLHKRPKDMVTDVLQSERSERKEPGGSYNFLCVGLQSQSTTSATFYAVEASR